MSNTISATALNSPIYNPTIDSSSILLYQNISGYSDSLLQQYETIISSMPTENIFSGILLNPLTCIIQNINLGINTMMGYINSLTSTVYTSDTTWANSVNPNISSSFPYQLIGSTPTGPNNTLIIQNPLSAEQVLSNFQNQSDMMIANFPSILGITQQALGITNAIQILSNPSQQLTNPTQGLANYMGSISGSGQVLLNNIQTILTTSMGVVLNIVNNVQSTYQSSSITITQIQSAISTFLSNIITVTTFIQNEIQQLAQAMINSVRMGMASSIVQLSYDIYAVPLVQNICTGPAIAILTNT